MFNQFPIKSNSIRAGFGSVQNFGSLNMARSIQTNMAMPFMYTPHTTLDQLGNQYGMEGFYPFPSGNSMMNMNMNMNPMMMGGCYQQPSKFEKGLMTFFGIASIATAVGGLLSILLGHKKANQAQENQGLQTSGVNNLQNNNVKIEDFSSWTNNDAVNPNGASSYALTTNEGLAAMQKVSDLVKNSASKEEVQAANTDAKKHYIPDMIKIAQEDILKNYDKNNDGTISEDEYVASELKQNGLQNLTGEELKLAKKQAQVAFHAMNIDTRGESKDVVTKEEYAAFLGAVDSNNSEGTADGRITKEEFIKSSEMFGDKDYTNTKNFINKEAGFYYNIKKFLQGNK